MPFIPPSRFISSPGISLYRRSSKLWKSRCDFLVFSTCTMRSYYYCQRRSISVVPNTCSTTNTNSNTETNTINTNPTTSSNITSSNSNTIESNPNTTCVVAKHNNNNNNNNNNSSDQHVGNTRVKSLQGVTFSQCDNAYTWETHKEKLILISRQERSWPQRIFVFGMPQGYPESCAIGFRRYFLLSMCSSSMSSFASSIGYQSMLNGFFLGSSPQLWMLKDLLPALAAAYLANRIVSYENRPKFWFVVSVVMHNFSVIAEMIIPSLLPDHLLMGAIVTSCVRQSASLMFLVARASALQHFAVSNNLAELTKKFNSFGMVIYTFFTALGIAYTSIVTSLVAQLLTVLVFCALNLVISHQSMSKIAFRVLNPTTLSVVLRDYVGKGGEHRRHTLTPQEVSDRIGLLMVDKKSNTYNDLVSLLYVSPPVRKLHIRSDSLEHDVLYFCSSEMFLLALWEPLAPLSLRERWIRWEFPKILPRIFTTSTIKSKKGEDLRTKFRQRLVLLVHQDCDQLHLLTAFLLAYTALLYHADTVTELSRFLRSCSKEQPLWLRYGAELQESLHHAGWDVHQLALDPPDFRLSSLRFAMGHVPHKHRNDFNN